MPSLKGCTGTKFPTNSSLAIFLFFFLPLDKFRSSWQDVTHLLEAVSFTIGSRCIVLHFGGLWFPARSHLFMDWSTVEAVWNFSSEPLLCSAVEVYGYYLITNQLMREAFGEKTYCFLQIWNWQNVNYKPPKGAASCPPSVLCLNYPKWWLLLKGRGVKDWFCWEHKVITIVANDGLISFFFLFLLRKLYPDFERGPEFYSPRRLCQGLCQGGSHERVKTQLTPLARKHTFSDR